MITKILTNTFLIFTATLSAIFSGCNSNDGLPDEVIDLRNDFFCGEGSDGIFINLDIDGTPLSMDLCNLSAQVWTNGFSSNSVFDTLFSEAITITGELGKDRVEVTFHGYYYLEELNVNDERAYANAVFGNDTIAFAPKEGYGGEEYTNDGITLFPPMVRPSFFVMNYHDGDHLFTSNSVGEIRDDFQEGSSIEVIRIEEIDYQNPEFENITYNYIVEATFTCKIHEVFFGEEKTLTGRFRLPFDAATTERMYQFPF
ncbi:MAG: hypothetical protein AAFO69_03070 [Bacteroidota bacterium]